MAYLAVLVLSALMASVRGTDNCDQCVEFIGDAIHFLLNDDGIREVQSSEVSKSVCPAYEKNPELCMSAFQENWPFIAKKAVYRMEPQAVCQQIGVCTQDNKNVDKNSKTEKPTCTDCKERIEGMAEVMHSEEKINKVIEILKGRKFCGDSSNLATWAPCADAVVKITPYALPALAGVIITHAPDICCKKDKLCC